MGIENKTLPLSAVSWKGMVNDRCAVCRQLAFWHLVWDKSFFFNHQLMMIKVCGMRDPENIRDVEKLNIDMMGFNFCKDDPRHVGMIASLAAIIPDYADRRLIAEANSPRRVGVFADVMPQNIVTAVYNYELDCVQLQGSESPVMIDNLRRTLDPDICKGVRIIKTLNATNIDDLKSSRQYSDHADMLVFNMKSDDMEGTLSRSDFELLDEYDGGLPFLAGGIAMEDLDSLKAISNPCFAGVDLNEGFETEPGVKDISKLKDFISLLRK